MGVLEPPVKNPWPNHSLLLQLWVGEKVNYSCKSDKKLFQTSNTSGLASITLECIEFGHLTPWWFPATLPPCLANLTQNQTFIGNYIFTYLFFSQKSGIMN